MAQDGEAFLYAIVGARTGDLIGTGSLVAADVVLTHSSTGTTLDDGDRVRVQLLAGEGATEVVDGSVGLVGPGLVLVALDRRVRTPVVALRLSTSEPTREQVVDALGALEREGGPAAKVRRPDPPGPPAASPEPAPKAEPRALPGGPHHGDDPSPPWCTFEPTWPGCRRFRP